MHSHLISPIGESKKIIDKIPICHMNPMKQQFADDGCMQVEYYECEYCGHTKEISRNLAG